jgi:hypothetical protein
MVVISRFYTVVAGLLFAACSSRDVPSSFPTSSPASLAAPEAPHAEVARSLREEPPLPGKGVEGWQGLQPETEAPAQGHEHAALFACPMHPEVTSDKPGVCPKCGMKLERRP